MFVHVLLQGEPAETKQTSSRASGMSAAASTTSGKPRLSALVDMSAEEAKRVSKAQSTHFDEAKLVSIRWLFCILD